MKGKDIVPGKDPVLDKALADLRKGLKEGEDPFYYDLNGLPTDTSETPAAQRTSALNGQVAPSTADASLTSRIISNVRRYGIRSALTIGALVGLGFVAVYALGFWRGKATVQTEGTAATVQLTTNAKAPLPAAPSVTAAAPRLPRDNPDTMPTALQANKASANSRGTAAPSQSVRGRIIPSTQPAGRTKKADTSTPPAPAETATPIPSAEPKRQPIFQNIPSLPE